MPEAGGIGIAREALVDVSAAVASRDDDDLGRALRLAARVADPLAVDEVLLQAHLFVGFPLALEALLQWRLVARRETPESHSPGEDPETWRDRGAAVCRTVYGGNYEKLRANVSALHPDLDRWMVEGGYGRVIGRPSLDLATRELCIVALLAVWNAPRQLHSHIRGALNAGASAAEVDDAIRIAGRRLGPGRLAPVESLWREIRGTASVERAGL